MTNTLTVTACTGFLILLDMVSHSLPELITIPMAVAVMIPVGLTIRKWWFYWLRGDYGERN